MILALTKTMHTRIIAQRRVKKDTQQRKVDSFTYSFMTNISRADLDWNEIEELLEKCFDDGFLIPSENFVKDIEISLDIPTGRYSVRFNSSYELKEDTYAMVVRWTVQAFNGSEYFVTESKPTDLLTDTQYLVEIELEKLSIDELDELIKQD